MHVSQQMWRHLFSEDCARVRVSAKAKSTECVPIPTRLYLMMHEHHFMTILSSKVGMNAT